MNTNDTWQGCPMCGCAACVCERPQEVSTEIAQLRAALQAAEQKFRESENLCLRYVEHLHTAEQRALDAEARQEAEESKGLEFVTAIGELRSRLSASEAELATVRAERDRLLTEKVSAQLETTLAPLAGDLYADYTAAKERIKELERTADELETDYNRRVEQWIARKNDQHNLLAKRTIKAERERDESRATAQRLRELLRKYGRHRSSCQKVRMGVHRPGEKCDCGWDQAAALAQGGTEG